MAASRFEKYRVARGDDIGDPSYWNRRFRDVDDRLVAVEDQKTTLDAVIDEGRTVFRNRVDEILVPLVQEVEVIADLGALLRAHSASEVEVSTGGKTFFVDEADRRRFAAPGYLSIVAVGNPSLAMSGRLVSYAEATGELVVDVDQVEGSGWGADWTISVGNTTDAVGDVAAARAARDATLGYRTQVEGFVLAVTASTAAAAAAAAQSVEANSGAQGAKGAALVAAADAATKASDAQAAATAAIGYLAGFLGVHAAPPTTRIGGAALQSGDWYFRTVAGPPPRYLIEFYDGAVWRSLTAASDTSVTSFAGRVGGIVPAPGDYTATQVSRAAGGGVAATTVEAALLEIRAAIDAAVATIDGGTFG